MHDLMKTPPEPPSLDLEDAWWCYEYRVCVEDFISPWFDDEFGIFEYLENVDEFLLTKKYVRTNDGIFEDNSLGDLLELPILDTTECHQPAGTVSLEDEKV